MSCPLLYKAYTEAMQTVYKHQPMIQAKHYERFRKREAELVEAGIMFSDYAMLVARLWKTWVKDRGFKCLPANVFCGPKSMEMYRKNHMTAGGHKRRKYDKGMVLADEYILCCVVIDNKGSVSVQDAITSMELSDDWHEAHRRGERPIKQVAEAVCRMRGVECTTTDYQRIGEIINDRRLQMEQDVQT